MQNNVIYGAFGHTRSAQNADASTGALARVENTPATLNQRVQASLQVLRDLASLIADSGLPKEATEPITRRLEKLRDQAASIATKLSQSEHDNALFLQAQSDLTAFGKELVEFESDVMHTTGAELELVEAPVQPLFTQVQSNLGLGRSARWINNPRFWVGLSVGVAAVTGAVWWGFYKKKPITKDDFPAKVTRVKLRRAMPAR